MSQLATVMNRLKPVSLLIAIVWAVSSCDLDAISTEDADIDELRLNISVDVFEKYIRASVLIQNESDRNVDVTSTDKVTLICNSQRVELNRGLQLPIFDNDEFVGELSVVPEEGDMITVEYQSEQGETLSSFGFVPSRFKLSVEVDGLMPVQEPINRSAAIQAIISNIDERYEHTLDYNTKCRDIDERHRTTERLNSSLNVHDLNVEHLTIPGRSSSENMICGTSIELRRTDIGIIDSRLDGGEYRISTMATEGFSTGP